MLEYTGSLGVEQGGACKCHDALPSL